MSGQKKPVRKSLLTGASIFAAAAAAFSAAPAAAQDAGASASEDEAIVVTGTRITRPGFTSASPISTIGSEELELQDPVNVEELLRNQPQFSSGVGSNNNNGSLGAATLDLRGLSEPRTLPLIDGKRMVSFDPNGLFDSTVVPLALLQRVDVVTGGASAVYGSDAIAGVVNFILNDDFQGVDIRYSHSWNDLHDSGDSDDYAVTIGSSFDNGRGNVALSVGYLNREPVYQVNGPASLAPGASSFSVPAAFDNSAVGPCGVNRTQFDAAGNLGTTGGSCATPYTFFDFNGQNLYQSPTDRWNATAIARYEINPNVEAYTRLIYSSSTVDTALASSAVFGDVLEIPLDNPFLSAQASTYLGAHNAVTPCTDTNPAFSSGCVNVATRWRARDAGPRLSKYLYDTFQIMGGLRGEFADNWRWDVAYAHGETQLNRQQRNDINIERIQQALFATSTTTCSDPSNGCVPISFLDPNTPVSGDQIAFFALNLQVASLNVQEYVTGSISGDLPEGFRSPLANSPIGVSFGAEWRSESSDFEPDNASQLGLSPGFGTTNPVHGSYDVMEFFTEALVPLVEDQPFAQSINLELGYRTSDYSTSGRVEAYKYGLDWTPIEGLRFRGMFQRAVRAANISELFAPNTGSTGDALIDPCQSDLIGTYGQVALCTTMNTPVGGVAPPTAGQVNNFVGGDPDLTPEVADTITYGLVWQPTFMSGLRATVDYYDIEVNNAISVRPAFDILDSCYSVARNPTQSATTPDCLLIIRDPTTGALDTGGDAVGVVQRTQNIGSVHVEGIDFGIAYTWDLGTWGSLNAGFDWTHLISTEYTPSATSGTIDCVGFFGKVCGLPSTVSASVGGPVAEDRWTQRTTWTIGDWDLSYRWRHISGSELDSYTAQFGANAETPIDPNTSIDDYDYIDLAASWQFNDTIRLSGNVSNITDEDAPFIPTGIGSTTFNSGNTYPATYDVLGRVFTVGVQAKF